MLLYQCVLTSFIALTLTACVATSKQTWVSFPSGERKLSSFLSKPKGNGPFKTIVYNHGSKKWPGRKSDLADFYNKHGFSYFIPHQIGHGESSGTSIGDRLDPYRGKMGYWKIVVKQLEADNDDVAAAVNWIKSQSFVDPKRIIMSGVSFGGMQTLLTAEKVLGITVFMSFAAAAQAWPNKRLQERLLKAVRTAKAPIFLIQAANDYNI
jgi:carboxymethylenebutenolidase